MIEVIDRCASVGGEMGASSEAVGRIAVGDFMETFRMDLSFWSVDDYRRSWSRALLKLEEGETSTACLISSITDPANSNFAFCWPLYRSGEEVFMQNSLIFLGELEATFDMENPWSFVERRRVIDDDGNRISEWSTKMSHVRQFRESGIGG